MPATRSSIRTKESRMSPGATTSCSGTFSFTPIITPRTFNSPPKVEEELPLDTSAMQFPPSSDTLHSSARRRPAAKAKNHIPRPPNAFMLFRSNFVKQKYIPGSLETNHNSLSKITATCWALLPEKERRIWFKLADTAKADHKRQYPEYKFRPIHGKRKNPKNDGQKLFTVSTSRLVDETVSEDLSIDPQVVTRQEFIAQCLLSGLKGDDLTAAVTDWDSVREESRIRHGPIAVPTLPNLPSLSLPPSRSSSVQPSGYCSCRSSPEPPLEETSYFTGKRSNRLHPDLLPFHCHGSYGDTMISTRPYDDNNRVHLPPIYPINTTPSFSIPSLSSALLSQYSTYPTRSQPFLPSLDLDFDSAMQRRIMSGGSRNTRNPKGPSLGTHVHEGNLQHADISSMYQPESILSSLERQCDEELYNGGSFLQHEFPHDQSIMAGSAHDKISLDFFDADSFDLLRGSPLSTISSELSSRSSTASYPGSPAPVEKDDVQIHAPQTMHQISGPDAEDAEMRNLYAVDAFDQPFVEQGIVPTTDVRKTRPASASS